MRGLRIAKRALVRPAWLEGVEIAELGLTGRMSLGSLAAALGRVARSGVGAAYALVWSGAVQADLRRPLSMATVVDLEGGS